MRLSCNSGHLAFKGHQVQIFADIFTYTVQKSLKPLLQVLSQKQITSSFPFHLNFSYKKSYGFSSLPEGTSATALGLGFSRATIFHITQWRFICEKAISPAPSLYVAETTA